MELRSTTSTDATHTQTGAQTTAEKEMLSKEQPSSSIWPQAAHPCDLVQSDLACIFKQHSEVKESESGKCSPWICRLAAAQVSWCPFLPSVFFLREEYGEGCMYCAEMVKNATTSKEESLARLPGTEEAEISPVLCCLRLPSCCYRWWWQGCGWRGWLGGDRRVLPRLIASILYGCGILELRSWILYFFHLFVVGTEGTLLLPPRLHWPWVLLFFLLHLWILFSLNIQALN